MHALHKCCARLARELCVLGPARAPLHERFARGPRLARPPPAPPPSPLCTHLHGGLAFCTRTFARRARGLCTLCTTICPAPWGGGRSLLAALCTSPSHALHGAALHARHEKPRLAPLHEAFVCFARGVCTLCTSLQLCPAPPQQGSDFGSARLYSAPLGSTRLRSALFSSTRLYSAPLGSIPLRSALFGSARLYSAPFGLRSQPYGTACGSALSGSVRLHSGSGCTHALTAPPLIHMQIELVISHPIGCALPNMQIFWP